MSANPIRGVVSFRGIRTQISGQLALLGRAAGSWLAANALLYDTFTTDESAPLTSPRTCEPGPGTLTISQTGDPFSVVAGELDIDQVAAAAHYLRSTDKVFTSDGRALFARGVVGRTPAGTIRIGQLSSGGASVDSWSLYGTTFLRPLDNVTTIATGRTGAGPHNVAVVRRSQTGVFFLYGDGTNWVTEWLHNSALFGTYEYAGVYDYDGDAKFGEIIAVDLASYNSAWGGDFSEVTDTQTGSGAFSIPATGDYSVTIEFTYTTGISLDVFLDYLLDSFLEKK